MTTNLSSERGMIPRMVAIIEEAILTWEGEMVKVPPGQWTAQEKRIADAKALIAELVRQ